MNYRLTVLTPLLVGDGRALSPIDYMVWRDQVNVLDQQRIFRLLARGPRLEGYLQQLKRADKLDFASWGGFAQNYSDRRIPFEHASSSQYYTEARAEHLHIPMFLSGVQGAYVPGSALKGAIRTGFAFSRFREQTLKETQNRLQGDRPVRRPGALAEDAALGAGGSDRLRLIEASDSAAVADAAFRIYLIRTAVLTGKPNGPLALGWKQSPRGAVDGRRPEQSTPHFAEMATPGTTFTGRWREREYLKTPEVARVLHWSQDYTAQTLFRAANEYALQALALHKQYAQQAGLALVQQEVERLEARVAELREQPRSCLLCLGWGGGLFSKAAALNTASDPYRSILQSLPYYKRAVESGLPFPKTRQIVFLENRPATLPGWVELRVDGV